MKGGLYGLASLDGAPLDREDRDRLLGPLKPAVTDAGLVAGVTDLDPCDLFVAPDGTGFLLVGDLHEPRDDARRLGLDQGAGHAEIAAAAFARWDADAATELAGEWLLLSWRPNDRTLKLTMSARARDDLYFAAIGRQVAFAPSLARLSRLAWVDDGFDGDALMRSMTAPPLRAALGDRTFIKGARRLQPAQTVVIDAAGVTVRSVSPPAAPTLSVLTFPQAMDEVEQLLRRAIRRRLAGHKHVAVLLSGGLDSSILAWLAAEEKEADARVHFLCSASPPGSTVPDETEWARAVAAHLGEPLHSVVPGPDADIYAPTPGVFDMAETPIPSPRHYLYEALDGCARDCGAGLILDGAFGEMTVSNWGFGVGTPRQWARVTARRLLDGLRSVVSRRGPAPYDPHHAMPSRQGLEALVPAPSDDAGAPGAARQLDPREPLGYETGWEKTRRVTTAATLPDLRYAHPFRDPQLIDLVATFPASFAVEGGTRRAMARALLRGHVPDSIVQRRDKMGFSPTYEVMLRDHAAAARGRIAAQRAAGAAEWVDLDWLDRCLKDAADGAGLTSDQAFRIQGTAMAAEFFRWWEDRRSDS